MVAVKRVNELSFYSLGLHDLAANLGLSPPRTLALVKHLGIQDSEEHFKLIRIGKTRFKRYSQKALEYLGDELPNVDMERVWQEHRPRRRGES